MKLKYDTEKQRKETISELNHPKRMTWILIGQMIGVEGMYLGVPWEGVFHGNAFS